MKRLIFSMVSALALGLIAWGDGPQASKWCVNNKPLNGLTESGIEGCIKGGKGTFDHLAARIRPAGQSDPIAATTFAKMTQYVMVHRQYRQAYAEQLMAAAKKSTDPEVTAFFIYQLRWCGLPSQKADLLPFTRHSSPIVSALATMTLQGWEREMCHSPMKKSEALKLRERIASLSGDALTAELLKAFCGNDRGCVSVALSKAREGGGEQATRAWMAALPGQETMGRKLMIIDLLGDRRDKAASPLLQEMLKSPEPELAEASALALLKIDPSLLVNALPAWSSVLPATQLKVYKSVINTQKSSKELVDTLISAYGGATVTAKSAILDFMATRSLPSALPLGMKAVKDENVDVKISGFRLLREIATADEATSILALLFESKGRLLPEAQNAFVVSARRDRTGCYERELVNAISKGETAHRASALEMAARLGGEKLLALVERASESEEREICSSAIRALSSWQGDAAVPVLIRLAVTGSSKRAQILSMRSLNARINKRTAKNPLFIKAWKAVKDKPGNEANKRALSGLMGF